jgi:hypothetical protein
MGTAAGDGIRASAGVGGGAGNDGGAESGGGLIQDLIHRPAERVVPEPEGQGNALRLALGVGNSACCYPGRRRARRQDRKKKSFTEIISVPLKISGFWLSITIFPNLDGETPKTTACMV